jgi:regulator of protease activity HflC (stomatin/prohibitin superfamily)
MSPRNTSNDPNPFLRPSVPGRWFRRGLALILLLGLGAFALSMTWYTFFHFVPPGKMLVVISKNGKPLPPGHLLAEPDEKGVQKTVLGEGWHWVTPFLYEAELKDDQIIEPGQVGLVTQLGGDRPPTDSVLVDSDTDQGIRRPVLPPGRYRINPYGYKVDPVPAVEIKPGFVGVRRRLLGKDGASRFAVKDDEKGILRDVLQPGTYYLNPKEYEVIPCEVGIYQTTYHYYADPNRNTAITFQARDGNVISMDCTIEWEVEPTSIPDLVAEFGQLENVEHNVIDQQAHRISRDRGFNYGAQDFLEGDKRERFQDDFTKELDKACEKQHVLVRSAFIRNIVIPEPFLKQQRDRQIAVETKTTTLAREETQESENQMRAEQKKIDRADQEVRAETKKLVAGIDQERDNVGSEVDTQLKELRSNYAAKMAQLDAERTKVSGDAKQEATKMKETATSSIHKMRLAVFQNDGAAYLRYTLADQLNKDVVLRLFHSGPGTLWTNLGDKNTTLMLPAPGATAPAPPPDK